MTHGSPYHPPQQAPLYAHPVTYAPQTTVQLVPMLPNGQYATGVLPSGQYATGVLPSGQPVVYTTSNPGTPSGHVVIPAAAPPPLSIAPAAVHAPAAPPCACDKCAKPAECASCKPKAAECASCKRAECAACAAKPAPASPSHAPCTVPGCVECPGTRPARAWAVRTATRSEAEHWVSRILGYNLDYLRALGAPDFQALIDAALHKAQDKPVLQPSFCPAHPGHPLHPDCVRRMHASNRRATEDWLHRMLKIPRPILQRSTANQLDALVTAALADFHHR